uniref:U3 small nucleolar ribonucleoprotein protein MPP10 n=1 Tax=Elaeophora elaphi TaxID=1147741 RepID=A0A158Q718_9BILA
MQNSTSRRRSRRVASQKLVDLNACSSTDFLGASDDEQASLVMKSSDESEQKKGMRTETLTKAALIPLLLFYLLQLQKDLSSQSSPIALRTRSRSRCSSMESNDADDTRKAINIVLTPQKNLMTAVKPRRKRTSLMPQLEEIIEEQQKCKDKDNKEEILMERKMETKKMTKKIGKLSGNERACVEVCGEKNSAEKSSKEDASKNNISSEKESAKPEQKIIEKSWVESERSPKKSSANASKKTLIKNSKKSLIDNSDHFMHDSVEISSAKNPDISSAKILGKSLTMIVGKFPEKSPQEMLTNSSSLNTNYLEQGTKLITATNLGENSLNIWPKLDDLLSLWLRCGEQSILVDSIERAYAFVNEVDIKVPAISEELITSNSETIWQQIAYGNKKFHRYFAKTKHFLDSEIALDKGSTKKRDNSFSSVTVPKSQDGSFENAEGDSSDFFNHAEDEVKRLDKDLDDAKMDKRDNDDCSNASNSEEVDISKVSKSVLKKHLKSAADDHFFSLAEMEEYLDKQEKGQAYLNENFFEQFDEDDDSSQNSQTNYHYADFYGSVNNIEEESDSKAAWKKVKKSKKVSQIGELDSCTEKKVTFADEVTNDACYESDQDNSRVDGEEATVLLGRVDEEEDNESEFQQRQKKLQERILSIEKANLAPRSWDLSGEVTAVERGENTMLEKHLDFDQSAPCAPVITVDTTTQLEAKIIQRIKDRAFDDVLRIERKSGVNAAYRAPVVESEFVKKSLAEVYEEQYQKTQYGVGNEEKMNEKHEEVKKLVSSLFQKLNALSHYRYIPCEVHPEVRILNNMPSLQKEEVGPLASTDGVLLAPEEIHKHVSGPIKGDDEKTKTDRSRLRRKKKKWQQIRQFKKQEAELAAVKNEMPAKKPKLMSQYDEKMGDVKLTSTSFFQRLQSKTAEEIKTRKYKVTEVNVPKKKLSTNYKL